jgi:ABC-type sulfate transport system substrate-binding protein
MNRTTCLDDGVGVGGWGGVGERVFEKGGVFDEVWRDVNELLI